MKTAQKVGLFGILLIAVGGFIAIILPYLGIDLGGERASFAFWFFTLGNVVFWVGLIWTWGGGAADASRALHLGQVPRETPSVPPRLTPYRTPRSAIAFLVVIGVLLVLLLVLDLISGNGPLMWILQLLFLAWIIFALVAIWLLARWWTGTLGPVAARCPACGRGYPKTAGPFCPWDGSKLIPAR